MDKNSVFNKFSKRDIVSGLIVFLIALPLCLGIAQASGAPLFSGIVAGIIGGIVVGTLSGSQLSVAGPAAGLTAIVLTAIGKLGAFDIFLCSVIVAGGIQLVLGFIKAGSLANYFPGNVIEGMLAGIGLTIIIKQIPEAVGYAKHDKNMIVDADDGFLMSTIKEALSHIHPAATIVAFIGLAILIAWQTKPFKKLQLLPAGLVVVIIGVVLNELFKHNSSTIALPDTHLVNLPIANSFNDFLQQFTLPNFAGFTNPAVWQTGIVIAVVASIETLLCLEATDKLDPIKRYTPTNRELKAQGVANMLSGLIGGLPMTSVIVRSSANINSGAKSKLSTIFHGVLLLVCVATIPFILNMIPKASLAAILIFTGYKLCKPSAIAHIWRGGLSQFIPFAATALAVVSLDLLKGVGIGLLISIFYLLRQNMRIPYYYQRSTFSNGELIKLTLAQEVSFLNKASIKETLNNLPPNTTVIIDASQTEYIDFDVLDMIREFYAVNARDKNITMSLTGFRNVYQVPEANATAEIVEKFMNIPEIPKRTAGNYRKLLTQLTKTKINVPSN